MGNVLAVECGLTGTKLGCGEGGCGACTVMVSRIEGAELVHKAVNACLFPLYAADGAHVVTVEGRCIKIWLQPVEVKCMHSCKNKRSEFAIHAI